MITNLFNKEILFGAEDFYKSGQLKFRNVYTFNMGKQSEYKNDFVWNFDCKNIN
jgi:hypothetical protein